MIQSISNEHTDETVRVVTTPGKMILRIVGILFVVVAVLSLVFGILGLMGIGLSDSFYLDNAITEARTLSANIDGVPMWTNESWQSLQENLIAARTVANNRASTQEQIDTAYTNLRNALNNMVLTEEFADVEISEFIAGERTVPIFFTYLIILSVFLGLTGVLSIINCANIKKMNTIGIYGVLSFLGMAILVVFAVDTLGYEVFMIIPDFNTPFDFELSNALSWILVTIATIILPTALLVGVYRNNKKTSVIVIFSVLAILSVIVLFPLWWIVRSSLMYLHEVPTMSFFPTNWVFSNYPRALERFHYFIYLRNTFIIATPAVVLGTGTAIMCAYSFARLRFRGKKFMFGLCIASMLLPPVVTLIPLFIMFTNFFGLHNTFWPLIIPWICGGGAFNIFLMRQFFLTLPKELDEAAMIDGAGRLRILVQILLPSVKPAIMVVGIFIFMLIWNDLLTQTVYLANENLHTMAMGLRVFSGSYGTEWHLTMVATVLSIIPGLIVYIIGQRYLVEGIVMTGMKN
ncbi:MAG: ABC transporter permease subunit [Oscillospiraceae bacterium]|jgi:multiple sugar transport system permease protein|nr:ABC transporter permease subunit [Oscillospiraceae bacterium]